MLPSGAVAMFQSKRSLSQNFLYNRQLVKYLLGKSSIGKNDTVLEIGPGKGIITQELSRVSNQVIAVELDTEIVDFLNNKVAENVILFQGDALKFPLPSSNFKVFSNPPFYIEGKLIRKLLNAKNPPSETCLVLIKKPALRWAGKKTNSMFSIIYGPWVSFKIVHQFKKSDFKPKAKVDTIFLKIIKRKKAWIKNADKNEYREFVEQGYKGGRRINQNLSNYFSNKELNQITQILKINFDSKPTDVCLKNWIKLFKFFKR